MTRLIDAEALKERLNEIFDNSCGIVLFDDIIATVDNAPTVDLKDIYQEGHYDGHLEGYTKAINEERPQGEWLEIPIERDLLYNTGIKYTCSICGTGNCYGKPPFCMYCGASMKKGGAKK